ncbi:MAG: alkaline phosphatase family protein [Bacteroidales bacterium]|nr:alkaline phosphatase family protein [Bacteroidales bacterium]
MKLKVFVLLIAIVSFFSCKSYKDVDSEFEQPYVVMLSMDGFRWDYPEKVKTPNLDYVEEIGVRAEASIPCFPSKTFPNHYSMATGLYPDNHGIVQNSFYATDIGKHYSVSNRESIIDPDFYFGEPIWITAEKQGVKSASYFWVGSEAPHDGLFPSYHLDYNGAVPFEKRIDGVIEWLNLPEKERPHLIMWYIQEPDGIGHELGPDHFKTGEMIVYLDSLVGVFNKKISELSISDQINVIITSDHGMGQIKKEKTVFLYDLLQKDWCVNVDGGNPVFSIDVKEEFYDTAYAILSTTNNITSWKKEEIPERLHFGKSPRVKDFVVVADSSWNLRKSSKRKAYSGGTHGYDNRNKDMHAIFYAYGPSFKKNYQHHSINNIDLYPLICEILNLKPQKVDGKLENVIEMIERKR